MIRKMFVPSDEQIRFMDALLSLNESIGDLSVKDMMDVINLAIQEGHEKLLVDLAMIATAVTLLKDAKQ